MKGKPCSLLAVSGMRVGRVRVGPIQRCQRYRWIWEVYCLQGWSLYSSSTVFVGSGDRRSRLCAELIPVLSCPFRATSWTGVGGGGVGGRSGQRY